MNYVWRIQNGRKKQLHREGRGGKKCVGAGLDLPEKGAASNAPTVRIFNK